MTVPTLAALSAAAMVGNKIAHNLQMSISITYADAPSEDLSHVVISDGYSNNVGSDFIYKGQELTGHFLALEVKKKPSDTFTFDVDNNADCTLIDADQDSGLLLIQVNAPSFEASIKVAGDNGSVYHKINLDVSNLHLTS